MTNFSVHEGSRKTVHSELRDNPDIKIGDTIDYVTNNQLGYQKYEVICIEKGLKLLSSEFDDFASGKRHKRRTNKRRTNKKKATKRRTHRK